MARIRQDRQTSSPPTTLEPTAFLAELNARVVGLEKGMIGIDAKLEEGFDRANRQLSRAAAAQSKLDRSRSEGLQDVDDDEEPYEDDGDILSFDAPVSDESEVPAVPEGMGDYSDADLRRRAAEVLGWQ